MGYAHSITIDRAVELTERQFDFLKKALALFITSKEAEEAYRQVRPNYPDYPDGPFSVHFHANNLKLDKDNIHLLLEAPYGDGERTLLNGDFDHGFQWTPFAVRSHFNELSSWEGKDSVFFSTKTGLQPYDVAVVACYALYKLLFGEMAEFESDGERRHLLPTILGLSKVLKADFPEASRLLASVKITDDDGSAVVFGAQTAPYAPS